LYVRKRKWPVSPRCGSKEVSKQLRTQIEARVVLIVIDQKPKKVSARPTNISHKHINYVYISKIKECTPTHVN
jgi:hypothetical protein